jgi:hypothetical protein
MSTEHRRRWGTESPAHRSRTSTGHTRRRGRHRVPGNTGWSDERASQIVLQTLRRVAAESPVAKSPLDGPLFRIFDLDIAGAFAERSIAQVKLVCRGFCTALAAAASYQLRHAG